MRDSSRILKTRGMHRGVDIDLKKKDVNCKYNFLTLSFVFTHDIIMNKTSPACRTRLLQAYQSLSQDYDIGLTIPHLQVIKRPSPGPRQLSFRLLVTLGTIEENNSWLT